MSSRLQVLSKSTSTALMPYTRQSDIREDEFDDKRLKNGTYVTTKGEAADYIWERYKPDDDQPEHENATWLLRTLVPTLKDEHHGFYRVGPAVAPDGWVRRIGASLDPGHQEEKLYDIAVVTGMYGPRNGERIVTVERMKVPEENSYSNGEKIRACSTRSTPILT